MKKIVGKCKLCGLEKELTFEHVPPKGAFNDTPSKRYFQAEVIQRLNKTEWETDIVFSKIRWERNQQKEAGAIIFAKIAITMLAHGTWMSMLERQRYLMKLKTDASQR